MKQTIKANIAGFVFNIDEDAYYMLKRYLDNIHSRFADAQEGTEIINDVEARIAEHFTEATQKKQVITKDDVNHVIEIMGNPKDFADEADDEQEEKSTKTSYKPLKRLYRDPDNSVLGGVCGGLGAYFNIDPIIVRALFIVLLIISIGTAIIVYILLWLITPKAETTAQKLEMRGQKVTVSSIEDRIKEEFSEVQDNFSKWKSSQSYRNLVNFLNEFGNRLWEILRIVLIVLGYIIGIGIIFIAFVSLAVLIVSLLSSLGMHLPHFLEFSYPWFSETIISESKLLLIGTSLIIGIPLIVIIYTGIKLIFKIPGKEKAAGITALIVWLIGILMVVFSVLELHTPY